MARSCGTTDTTTSSDTTTLSELPSAVTSAAQTLLQQVSIATTAKVIVVGPLPISSVLKENLPTGHTATAKSLTLPSTTGTYYVFFIDDNPDLKFKHEVRFAYVNTNDGTVQTLDAGYPMVIERPGETKKPFSYSNSGTVNGITFNYATGDGKGDVTAVSKVSTDTGKGISAPFKWSPLKATDNCTKKALVVDGGEARGYFFQNSLADNMAEDADAMESYLSNNGFTVTRRSQYWGNSKPAFTSPENRALEDRIKAMVNEFTAIGCDNLVSCSCHEFWIYIVSHGDTMGFSLYPMDGDDTGQIVFYEDLLEDVLGLPSCVKVSIFIDACYSGGLITENQKPPPGSQTPHINNFCSKHCGMTLMTSSSDSKKAAGGQGIDSGTEDFTQGSTKDHDGDGKTGDLKDRVTEMQNQGSGYSPQLLTCTGQSTLCSLD